MTLETNILILIFAIATPIIALSWRLLCILPAAQGYQRVSYSLFKNEAKGALKSENSGKSNNKNTSIMVLLGSGGHTGEMIRLLSGIELKRLDLTWLVSEGDTTSIDRARDLEVRKGIEKSDYIVLARARKVGESFSLSIFSSIRSLVQTILKLTKLQTPDILLINGPGTCVPVAYVLFIFRLFGLGNTRIIYVESLARVNNLSLSGKLVFLFADRFIVQWRPLAEKYHRAEYYGILV